MAGKFSVKGALNATTGWLDLSGDTADLSYSVFFSGSGTVSVQMSDDDAATKTKFDTIATYTSSSGRRYIPTGRYGRYMQFILTGWSSGDMEVHIGKGRTAIGHPYDIQVQGSGNLPSSQGLG